MAAKDIFISHSSKDNEVALKIASVLTNNKITYWLDLNDIPADGGTFAGHITQGLEQAKIFLLILSSSANASPHVLNEINMAFSKRLPFLIYNLDLNETEFSDDLKYYLASKQFIKVFELGEQRSLQMLLNYIKDRLNGVTEYSEKFIVKNDTKPQGSSLRLKIFTALLCAFSAGSLIHTYAPDLIKFSNYKSVNFQIGDIVELGTYHNNPILWVYAGNDQPAGEPSFISRNLLTAKPFDIAHSGKHSVDRTGLKDTPNKSMKIADRIKLFTADEYTDMYGSADYENSSLRTWLNSADNSVKYVYTKPAASSIKSTGKNKYLVSQNLDNLDEGGFLTGFTPEERAMLRPVTVRYLVTANNVNKAKNKNDYTASLWKSIKLFPDADSVTENNMTLMLRMYKAVNFRNFYYSEVKELVSLPSIEEISHIYSSRNLNLQSQFDYARPTDDDVLTDNGWWTRTPCGMMPYTVCMVHSSPNSSSISDMQVTPKTVSTMATVRPVIHLRSEEIECIGDGSRASPYKCRKK